MAIESDAQAEMERIRSLPDVKTETVMIAFLKLFDVKHFALKQSGGSGTCHQIPRCQLAIFPSSTILSALLLRHTTKPHIENSTMSAPLFLVDGLLRKPVRSNILLHFLRYVKCRTIPAL